MNKSLLFQIGSADAAAAFIRELVWIFQPNYSIQKYRCQIEWINGFH